MIVADTDILVDALRGHQPMANRVADAIRAGSLATTAISVFELQSGARTETEREKVDKLLAPITLLPFDDLAAQQSAHARRTLEADGRTIGMADYLIAGVCLSHEAELFTRNTRHFERVEGLRLVGF